jgi:membrane dipeptidase
MKSYFFSAAILLATAAWAQPSDKLHRKSLVIDTHNDFISVSLGNRIAFDTDLQGRTHSDLNRMFKGGIDAQFFSIFGGGDIGFAHAMQEIDSVYAIEQRNPSRVAIVQTPAGLKQAVRSGKMAALMGVEGGHMIEDDLNKLQTLYNRGVRYMTLTWNNSTKWASSAAEETSGKIPADARGLNEFGQEVVRKMNEIGMMVDISHVGEKTFWDVMKIVSKPVIASHSSVYHVAPVFRNLKDDQIDAIGKNGGVICVNFYSGFLDSTFDKKSARPPLSKLIDHIEYIVKRIGVDHVGLGSDFDGIGSSPQELDGVQDFPKITRALQERGYSKKDIRKILGENVQRVFAANARS